MMKNEKKIILFIFGTHSDSENLKNFMRINKKICFPLHFQGAKRAGSFLRFYGDK